jgi:phytanoyl-CoA hydroxylase
MATIPADILDVERFHRDGYLVVPGLYDPEEVASLLTHYLEMHHGQQQQQQHEKDHLNESLGDTAAMTTAQDDPLRTWPRLMMMHRHDPRSRELLLDPRLRAVVTPLLAGSDSGGGHNHHHHSAAEAEEEEPYAVQTMMYFKPPLSRGQALHQDQYYLRVQPGTCLAAWLALDDCDTENGCIQVIPGSHHWPGLLCTIPADTSTSFTDVTVRLPSTDDTDISPPPCVVRPVPMRAGDVLFFHGQLVHGSGPNTSTTRFRRSLIAHYVSGQARQVYHWYRPAYRLCDGDEVPETQLRGNSEIGGGQCGHWVTVDGRSEWELVTEVPNEKVFGLQQH